MRTSQRDNAVNRAMEESQAKASSSVIEVVVIIDQSFNKSLEIETKLSRF